MHVVCMSRPDDEDIDTKIMDAVKSRMPVAEEEEDDNGKGGGGRK
jgi:hypothetical protein